MNTLLRIVPILALSLLALPACGGGGGGATPESDDSTPGKPPIEAPPGSIHVDAARGSDDGDGSGRRPLKTITHALSMAREGQSVRVASGTYDVANGERFPLMVGKGVTLESSGMPRAEIAGAGLVPAKLSPDGAQIATIVPGEDSRLIRLRLVNRAQVSTSPEREVHVAVVVAAHPGAALDRCSIVGGQGSGILFMPDADGITIESCHVSEAAVGLRFPAGGGELARIEYTRVVRNQIGVSYARFAGEVDLGGGPMRSRGFNLIGGNELADLVVYDKAHIMARHNYWDHEPTPTIEDDARARVEGGIDIWNGPGATVDTTGALGLPTMREPYRDYIR